VGRDRAARPEAKPLRLFVAADVPDDVRANVAEAVGPLRERLPGARWTPPANWHVTLKFLGTTWPRLVEWVTRSVEDAAARAAPFRTSVVGLGAFPSARRARVLWAGLDDPGGAFGAVAAALDEALASEFEPEKRPFSAHLTVARLKEPAPIPGEVPEVATASFDVDRIVLYRSRLQRPAPIYEPLDAFPLRGPAGSAP
jgi:RNA 2',3'-cyclic 3'-phosphodiesterase